MVQQTEAGRPREAETKKHVVDYNPANLGVMNAFLQPLFRVRVAHPDTEARELADHGRDRDWYPT